MVNTCGHSLNLKKAEELWEAINMARDQPSHTLSEPHFNHHYINIAL